MEDLKLKQLQERAIHNVMVLTTDANVASTATRVGELNSLHVAAHMDIGKTAESLKPILEYKKEVANQILQCSHEKTCEQLAQLINHADDMIKKVLGVYVP
jgi:mevalonate kinase